MAATLSTTLTSGVACDYRLDTGTVPSGLVAIDSNRLSQSLRIATAECDLCCHDHATLAHAATRSIDLDLTTGTPIEDVFGTQLHFATLHAIYVKNLSALTADVLTLGGDANTVPFCAASDVIKIGPGGVALLTNPDDGWVVTDATGDIIKLSAVTGTGLLSIAYDSVLIGKSA